MWRSSCPTTPARFVAEQLDEIVAVSSGQLGLGAILSIVGALYVGSKGTFYLFRSLNLAYGERETRGLVKVKVTAILFTVLFILAAVIAIGAVAVLPAVLGLFGVGQHAERLIELGRWPALAVAVMIGLELVYRFGPDRKAPRWHWLTIGSVTATSGWLARSYLFSLYVAHFGTFNETYGSLGTVVVLMVWLYLSATLAAGRRPAQRTPGATSPWRPDRRRPPRAVRRAHRMKALIHRRPPREHATGVTAAYVALAVLLGLAGDELGASTFAAVTSPMSSPSAIAILSAIAAGTMALTAIMFSLVFLGLEVGSNSYSPRLVSVFGRSPFLGHVLGVFTGTFIYALLAIRTVDIAGGPGVNVSVVATAFLWLLASIAALVLLLPRIRSLTIGEVLRSLERSGASAAARVYAPVERAVLQVAEPPVLPITGVLLHTTFPTYLLGLDLSSLVRCASEAGGVLVVPFAIGDAIIPGDRLVLVRGATRPVDEKRVRRAVWLGKERGLDNDPAYALRLLVDIAIRALSPAVNDPTTAVSTLDEIDALLRQLGHSRLEDHQVVDDEGVVRLVHGVPSWEDIVALALTEIHQYGRESLQVQRRLAALVRDLSELLPDERRPAIEQFELWRVGNAAPGPAHVRRLERRVGMRSAGPRTSRVRGPAERTVTSGVGAQCDGQPRGERGRG